MSLWTTNFALVFHKINGYIKNYDESKYPTLISFDEKYEQNVW